jgi:ribonuclease P protein component
MYVLPLDIPGRRIVISVAKRLGTSVERHRIKRLFRETYRLNKTQLTEKIGLLVVAQPAVKGADFKSVETAWLELCRRAEIFHA